MRPTTPTTVSHGRVRLDVEAPRPHALAERILIGPELLGEGLVDI